MAIRKVRFILASVVVELGFLTACSTPEPQTPTQPAATEIPPTPTPIATASAPITNGKVDVGGY